MMSPQPSDGFRWTQASWGEALSCEPLAAVAPHVFTAGNLRLHEGDEQEWAAVARAVGAGPGAIRLLRQVHGVSVAVIRANGTPEYGRPEADIIISDDPASAVGVRVADCAPVLLADRRLGVVGAAHAGWRGTAQRAAAVAVGALHQTFGCDAADIFAAIGPCLGPCCGEVGPEVVQAFRDAGHASRDLEAWFTPGASDRSYLNLWAANRDQLFAGGVPASQIFVAGLCTRTHQWLMHSYRAHGARAGRMAGVIRARGGA